MTKVFLCALLSLCAIICRPQQQRGCFQETNDGIRFETNIDFGRYNVFFLGEFHGVYGTPEIKLALIKYLNQQRGITDVFMEISYGAAYLYNSYLNTGDTTLLRNPVLNYYMKRPDWDFWRKLYTYNTTLKKKITIRGMDFERIEFLKVLKLLMPPGKEKPIKIYSTLEYIDTVPTPNIARVHSDESYAQSEIYRRIRNDMIHNAALYQSYFGNNYKTAATVMFNVNTYSQFDKRNEAMYDNIMKQVAEDDIEQFIVFSGLNHAGMSDRSQQSLCYRLTKTHAAGHTVADIAMVCKNCYDWQLQPNLAHAAYRAPYSYLKDTALIDDIYQHHDNRNCKYTLIPTDQVDDARVSRFSNFILLMKDQPDF